ncbi:hypothetical protein, partial [Alistipes putredinis]|uniref:hypothetical protein n=1 Tax=Alistipes putredinis TaxID=28117 RepID=UPI003AB24F55
AVQKLKAVFLAHLHERGVVGIDLGHRQVHDYSAGFFAGRRFSVLDATMTRRMSPPRRLRLKSRRRKPRLIPFL